MHVIDSYSSSVPISTSWSTFISYKFGTNFDRFDLESTEKQFVHEAVSVMTSIMARKCERKFTAVDDVCAMLMLKIFAVTFVGVHAMLIVEVEAAPHEALITSLPGFSGKFASKHYAGYINVDREHGRSLYYYFVTSQTNPVSDPLVVWLNGGPGCSSFDGFVYEHGPFNFVPGNGSDALPKLERNPYTWAKVANMLYVDSPAGVGFSYSNNSDDYTTGDIHTASDLHAFLLKWFHDYPEFLSNALYISGESYAGVYVPTLTQEIVKGIESGMKPTLNLKGYMVGNGVTDVEFDGNALVPFAYGMGLISIDLYKETINACNGNFWNATNSNCVSKLDAIDQNIEDLNIYDILEPCYHSSTVMGEEKSHKKLPESFRKLGKTDQLFPVRRRMFGRAWPLRSPVRDGLVPNWYKLSDEQSVPCLDTHLANTWLNNADVRQALHALPERRIGKWLICADKISYFHDAGSMIPIHRNLTGKGYRAIIYSGDHDLCVPFTGSEAWTRSLAYKVVDEWRPWFAGQQVAGYTTSYENSLTFATVKGSGHTVPEYKPLEALSLFQRWIAGNAL